jgi:hypothetical protein
MLVEGMKNRSKERNNIFFTSGKFYIGAVAEPEPKSLEQLSAVRKMPVDGSRSHAGRRRNGFMGEAIERVTAQHAHGDIEDLFSGRSGLPAAEWGFVSRWLHGSKLL